MFLLHLKVFKHLVLNSLDFKLDTVGFYCINDFQN